MSERGSIAAKIPAETSAAHAFTGASIPFKCLKGPHPPLVQRHEGHVCIECGAVYPTVRGVPRFVSAENYAESFGFQWNIHARTQLDSHTGKPISRDRLFGVTGWPQDMHGLRVLEAGSGAGRFTEVLLGTGAEVYSFDFSAAVDANYRNNGSHPSLRLFQADIFDIPLPVGVFDKVMCLGVLQHTPDPERAFRSLARFVRPGGELAIDVYALDVLALMQWKYFLRPLTTRMRGPRLYRVIESWVPRLIPAARWLRRHFGRAGARLVPIIEYSHLELGEKLNIDWSVLDTFDMYSPTHDHPQSLASVRRWFHDLAFEDVRVVRGPNGVTGRGRRPR